MDKLITIPVAPGELVDKITILEIKAERIADPDKRANVRHELEILRTEEARHLPEDASLRRLAAKLKAVNSRIWELEDTIRECELNKDFGDLFLETARQIYRTNDERAALKNEINLRLGSTIVEEKSYKAY